MKNINLKNGYVFPYDDTKKYICYFGCNSVGKTVISNALDEMFTSQGKEVLHFSNDLMEKMIDVNEKNKNIQIFPKIIDINKLTNEKKNYTDKFSFSKQLKEIGLATVSDRKMFPKIKECSEEDGIVVEKESAVFSKDELKDIFEFDKKKTKHNSIN